MFLEIGFLLSLCLCVFVAVFLSRRHEDAMKSLSKLLNLSKSLFNLFSNYLV
jgi:hypothetical protein